MSTVLWLAYVACVPLANWFVGNIGACSPSGPCVIPVAPGLSAPSGVLVIGVALVLRDLVQRRAGLRWAVAGIAVGAGLSLAVAPPWLAAASCSAFLASEVFDALVFTALERRGFITAAMLSSLAGAIVDSALFLWVALGSLDFLAGQVIGKTWAVLATIPILGWLRRSETA